ncbi:MAG: SH3 domain-containing protein [Bacilli bacterium]|nr:SH3 domain-containing protein [Bacilli bacterium]
MKKILNFILVINILFCYLFPINFNVKAEGVEYIVSVLNKKGDIEQLGKYTDYNEAKKKMNDHESTSDSVAVIYKNGKLVNAKYAMVKFIPGNVARLYQESTKSYNDFYTAVHTSYGLDAAFIDYDPNTNRVKLKISGFTGWVDASYLNIVPIVQLYSNNLRITENIHDALNVRDSASSNGNKIGYVVSGQVFSYTEKVVSDGYTWYKINYNGSYGWIANVDAGISEDVDVDLKTYYQNWESTGNLLHYFAYNTSGVESSTFTNLGPAPSFLTPYKNYYSFDGNYFYDDIIKMLDDYKSDNYSKAVNKNNPFYAYYLYLPNRSQTAYTADDLNFFITQKGYTSKPDASIKYVDDNGNFIGGINRNGISLMVGEGASFIASQETYGVNALLTFSAAINESATGTSAIAFAKNNLFGHSAYDSCPFTCATTYKTVSEAIYEHARLTGENYNNPNHKYYHGSHYGNKGSGMNVMYATDPYWGEKAAQAYFFTDNSYGRADYLYNTLGLKTKSEDIFVYAEANSKSKIIYNVNNDYETVSNIPLIVLDKFKNNDGWWYKVYTEIGLDENKNIVIDRYDRKYSYGYVKEEDLYVSNSQPVISAKDINVKAGDKVDFMNGVKATDKEDGDITSKIKYETNAKLDIPGEYSVTYTVKDNSNFSVSKTVKVSVEINTSGGTNITDDNILENLDKTKTRKESLFYMDYLKETDGHLVLRGYSTINGINNNLSNDIKYNVLLENVDTGKITTLDALRITDKDSITRVPYSDDNLDYTYSWFEYKFDLNKISAGNYRMYVLAQTDKYYSLSIVSNKLYKEQVTGYIKDKSLIIYRNFNDKTGAIELNVRNNTLANKNSSYMYNQYDTYRAFEFVDNKLHLKGLSYSYGADLNKDAKVERKIIFENKETYQTFTYDLGSITNGLYPAVLPADDNLDKTRAWYDNTIDISNIPVGEYVIYVTTKANITDIAEFTEKLGRKLDSVTTTINGKKYSFIINYNKGNRIELIVK